MSESDYATVCSKIDESAMFLNKVSQDIWKNPELGLEEVRAHGTLTTALEECGFSVQKNYVLPTAFRGEYSSKSVDGPVIAILLEFDALPEIGHACGHNLIAEAGLAAGIAIKAVMEKDPTLVGKLVLLGSPDEEGQGGKINLINAKAFDGIDAAMMVHPASYSSSFATTLGMLELDVHFYGKESHASDFPWKGCNALDAAVACYQNLALLRQQMKPSCRLHAIITKGGAKANIIPGHTSMDIWIRTETKGEMGRLHTRVLNCIRCSAEAAGCTYTINRNENTDYESVLTNKVMAELYQSFAKGLGLVQEDAAKMSAGSTDMGNVSRVVPSIHPFFAVTTHPFHSKEFASDAGSLEGQAPTLNAGKAMALTALKLMRCPKTLEETKKHFQVDLFQDMQ